MSVRLIAGMRSLAVLVLLAAFAASTRRLRKRARAT